MQRTLANRVAIVAGAGPGIGRSTALTLAGDGASLVLAARRREPLESLAAEVRETTGRPALPVVCDIADAEQRGSLIERTLAEFGRLDALVNVASAGSPRAAIPDLDWDDYRAAADFIVVATLDLCGRAARAMAATGGGSIINIGALSSTTLLPKMASYTSNKAAMVAASKTLAREVGRDGVRINIVTPGFTTGTALDEMFEQMAARGGKNAAELKERAAREAALERHVDPEDIAEACLFLASDRGRNITGVELQVNAGQWIG